MASIKFTPAHPTAPWRVYHRGKDYWFKTEDEAAKKVKELSNGKGAFSARELDEYRYVQQLLRGTPLLVAVRSFLERGSGESETTVSEAVKRHALTTINLRPDTVQKRTHLFKKLSDAIGDMRLGDVRSAHVEKVMTGFASNWTRNDFLKKTRCLFRYCIKRQLTNNDPTRGMDLVKMKPSKVILSLEDTSHLLSTCATHRPDLLPAIALQVFTGIRTAEVRRLQWSCVQPGKLVDIPAEVSKTHERRVIDWWPTRLTEYIDKNRSGAILPNEAGFPFAKVQLMRLCKKMKPEFVWGQNAIRHSYASYAVAYWQGAEKVSLLMGQHDAGILFRHYRDYRTQAEGAQYFGMSP